MLNVKYVHRGVFRTKFNIYDGAFLPQQVTTKCSFVGVWLGSKYASGSLDAPCEMVPLNSFILQHLCHNQFAFCFRKWKHYTEKDLIANFTRFTIIFKKHLHNTTSWYTFFYYKTSTVGMKTKNLPRATRFGWWSFYKGAL